ncbi:MAG TPA: hypothetical protein VN493_11260 [Thermoanaerobaculia bacterium]|nr:hypothetical protein [Thermoanaerobaculia bacterium]
MNTSKSKPLAKVFWPVLLLSAALSLPVDSFAAPSPRERNAQAEKADKNERRANRAQKQEQRQQVRQHRQEKRTQKQPQKQEVRQDRQRNQNEARNQGQERRAAAQRQADLNRQRAAEKQREKQLITERQRSQESRRQAQLQQRQAEARHRAELQRQAVAKHRANQLRANRQAEINRQAALQRQAEINRRTQFQRQTELNRRAQLQRQAEINRQAELRRRAQLQQRYAVPRDRYYNDNQYRTYAAQNRWNRGDTIAVDGHLTNEGYNCQALRDDNGQLYMLVGNTYGLRNGDHARVVGRVVDGGHCDWEGTAFQITDVTALWADRRHRTVYYHQNHDGGQFGHRDNWMGRRPRSFQNRIEQQRYGYYDRDSNRYDDRYRSDYDNHNGNRQLIIREGRVANNRGCPVLVSGNDQFGLTGNVGGLRNGDRVKVTGFLEGPNRCAGRTIRVGEIQ